MYIINKIKNRLALSALVLVLLSSCNKLYVDPTPIVPPGDVAGNTLAKALAASPNDSLFYRLVIKSGILTATPATITDSTLRFTMFVPDNNAMKVFINAASGGLVPLNAPDAVFSAFITANIPVTTALPVVSYNIIPQAITTASFPTSFPNLNYATIFNPAPTLSSLFRLTVFLSKRGSINWVNNIPLSSADMVVSNGIIHHVPVLNTPPSTYLWDRISTDGDMTYLKAAIQRADSGVAAASTLQAALQNIGANLTVFVPTDSAMRAALTGLIAQGLIAQGVPPAAALPTAASLAATPAVFSNPALYTSLTPTLVKGIVVYHILGTRAFSVNLPTTATRFPTLLNTAIAAHPGVSIQATLTGPSVTAATVKGVANASASNIKINPVPGSGTSDQNYLNGIIHKIDQVLIPQ